MLTYPPLSAADLDHVLSLTFPLWEEARGQRFFLTGGSGFFGAWLVESFLHANRTLGLESTLTILLRDPNNFVRRNPHLAGAPQLILITGNIVDFSFPAGRFDYAIHAAVDYVTEPGCPAKHSAAWAELIFERNMQGTRRFLDFVQQSAVRKFLFTSSGAVYGKPSANCVYLTESDPLGPDPTNINSAYGEYKRAAELLCSLRNRNGKSEGKIARCFAFVGPRIEFGGDSAITEFIAAMLDGKDIQIRGDGTPIRTYLYAADLAVWLWTILFRGTPGEAYNVGGNSEYSIYDVADTVRAIIRPKGVIHVARDRSDEPRARRYVPNTEKAQRELGLDNRINLKEAIRMAADWYSSQRVSL